MKVHVSLFAVIAFSCSLQAQDPDRVVAKSELGKTLDVLVQRYGDIGFSGSVLVAKEGKVLLARGVGYADLAGKKPNTANTLFELASATKQFTAAAICRLKEQGKLKLDDSIAEHLPDVPKDCSAITIRHLLTHTSGIPGTNSRGSGDDLTLVMPLFLKGGPKHKPGTHWEYWNQGYSLLAAIIERRSGVAYSNYCREQLFKRAGMRGTCFTGDPVPRGARDQESSEMDVAVGRSARGKPRSALEHPYGSYGYQYRGMGGAVSNVWDLWRWHRALQGNEVLSAESKRALFKPLKKNYALGWFVRKKKGRVVQSHGGGVRGFVCEIRRYPKQDAVVFVLANFDRAPFRSLSDALESALFGEEFVSPPAVLSKAMQSAFVGSYKDKKGRRLIVEAEGTLTRARIEWSIAGTGPTTRGLIGMEGASPVFFDHRTSEVILIRRDDDGAISELFLQSMRFQRSPQ